MSRDPIGDLRAWQERFLSLSNLHAESWAPAIDVYETSTAYVVAAEVPGLSRDQVEMTVEASRLTIRGQRIERRTASGEVVHFHQIERGHGLFARTFEFAERIDADRVSADLSNGVLTVTLPKVPPPPARRIQVK